MTVAALAPHMGLGGAPLEAHMKSAGLTSMASFERALGLVLVLNLLDAALTSIWVSAGIVPEGNPMMAWAMELGFGAFVLSKVALVGLGGLVLYRLREVRMARVAILPAAVLYAFVMGNHVGIGAQVLGIVERGLTLGSQLGALS